jgi:hypothetical protein
VAERFGEEPVLHAPVVAAADQLFLQVLVDALGRERARQEEQRWERHSEDAPPPTMPEHMGHG